MARARLRLPGRRVLLLSTALTACGEAAPDPPATSEGVGADAEASALATTTYEQSFVFASISGDSVFLVPWLMRTVAGPDSVQREARGWLARGGAWDAFYSDAWASPPTRAPTRILPHGSLRLLVQEGDVIDGILFEDRGRRLELSLGEVLASWGGPRGEAISLMQGAAYLADERIEGIILHMARASAGASPPGGDWAFLISGDSLRIALAAEEEHGAEIEPLYRVWADLDEAERLWPEVRVDWASLQAFPPARRDVPVEWRIWAADESIEGDLAVVSAEIQPGPGPGPLLPVLALFEVSGSVSTADGTYPVRGLLVHERR